jgi:excisionase family DNA binding protein
MVNSTLREKLKIISKDNLDNDFMSTTELARYCGVSRFTINNWINKGRINTLKTVGGKNRIPATEAISFIESMHRRDFRKTENSLVTDALGHCWEYPRKTNCNNRCKSCLIYGREVDYCFIAVRQFGEGVIRCQGDCLSCEYFGEFFGFYNEGLQAEELPEDNDKRAATTKRNVLYKFGYGIGRSVHRLKKKGKVK